MTDVQPKPHLADVPMKPAPSPGAVDCKEDLTEADPSDPPTADVTLPTE